MCHTARKFWSGIIHYLMALTTPKAKTLGRGVPLSAEMWYNQSMAHKGIGMNPVRTLAVAAVALAAAGWGWGKAKVVEAPAPKSGYVSPEFLAVAPDGASVYVTSATGAHVQNVALDGSATRMWKIESTLVKDTPLNPSGIAVQGPFVYVTCGVQAGELQKYGQDGKLVKAAAVGHSPCSPVVSADGKTAYVLNRFAAKVSVVDTDEMKVVASVPVLREPFAAALGAGGKLLFVANMLPFCAATNDVVAAAVSVIDTATRSVRHVLLPNGSTGVRGMCASPDGKSIYVTHTMGRYQLPTTQLERGWMNTPP